MSDAGLWGWAAASVGVAAIAWFGDRKRAHRKDLDRVGWIPWPLMLVLALLAAAILAALSLVA